ncbi:protein mesh-like [Bradysia coprophila]|uniref:protein mesh-like n=1 Tax=Bradysia coprophila TaxID=38358 RepID=UPI00187D9C4A|nr:protein mesh-like [Bradysia coprophila]
MQWSSSLLVIVLIGLTTVNGAWKRNQEYNYKVVTKTLRDEKWDEFQTRLTIRPESDEILIGKLGQTQYGNTQTSILSGLTNRNNNDRRMEEQLFKVKVKNGVVEALLVDRQLSEYQINQLKSLVNAFVDKVYVDRNVQCQMDGDHAFYNMNEQTMMGHCETIYEISPLAEYLAQSSRDLVPMPQLQRQGQYTDVIKSRDYNKCNQNRNDGSSPNTNRESTLIEVNRVILSGPLNDYTVQSAFSTLKLTDRLNSPPKTISYVNVTLESFNTNTRLPSISIDNLVDVQNNYSPRASLNTDNRIGFIGNRPRSNLPCTSKHAAFRQLTITPSFVSIVGHTPITIQGPSLSDAVRVQVRFHDAILKTVTATISGDKATCLVPYLYTNGRMQVDMIVTRTNTVVDTFYGFIYTEKHRSAMNFELLSSSRVKMTWDKTKFNVGAPLRLELLELVEGVLTPRGIIKSNITNNGAFTGDLDMQGTSIVQQLRSLYVVKLESALLLSSPTVGVSARSVVISNFLNQLSTKTQAEIDQMCYDWYAQDEGAPRDALPCPPTLQKARVDERFEPVDDLKLYNPDADFGFMQRVPSKSGAAQRCVYKNGKLLVGPPSGGNVRKVSPNGEKGEVPHIIADIMPWFLCCNNNKANCNLYYEKRPSNNGSDYVDPHSGMVIGDPHFTTFDGFYYTFLGLGEFWIFKSQDDVFSMQGRFTQYLNTGATVCTVYVMQHRSIEGDTTIQLSLMKDYIEIMIDGQVVTLDSRPNTKRSIAHKGAFIAINSQKDIRITFSSGYSFKFTYDPYVINMIAMLDVNLKNTFRGLFGNFDDNQENEFTYPDGRVIPKNSKAKEIHDFGMNWKVDCQDSLFTYPDGKSYENYQDDNYVPRLEPIDVDKLPPKAKEICGDNYECLFDFAVTGNQEMATSTKTTVDTFTSIIQSLSVTCPRLSAPRNGSLQVRNYFVGSIVKLVCNDNFAVQGNDSMTCARNARGELSWQGTLGQCVQKNKCANENSWLQWLCEHGLQA